MNNQVESSAFVSALRRAAPYIHAHNGRVFVVAFGGEVAQRDDFQQVIYDIALLHSLGVRLVLVHGARPQIDAMLAARRLAPRFVDDVRVTDLDSMQCVRETVGALRMDIEARLSTGLASTPMGGARLRVAGGNWITAKPVGVRQGVDHQLTGEVRRVDIESIKNVLMSNGIALLSPIGYSPTGETFNLRAGDVAQAVATGLRSDKLIYLLNSSSLPLTSASQVGDAGQLPLLEAEAILAKNAEETKFSAEDRALLRSAISAGRGGVARIHLVGSHLDGALLRELYTRDGCGFMLDAGNDYETIRRANIDDIGGIVALIKPLEQLRVLVPRSREQLELEIGDFDVIVRDGTVIACAATFPFVDNAMAEFSCLAVQSEYRGTGRASSLLHRAEDNARNAGIKRLFVLTTHTPHWFIEHGFVHAKIGDLPINKQDMYNYQRNSIVLVKDL